jgi:hypothetical protein
MTNPKSFVCGTFFACMRLGNAFWLVKTLFALLIDAMISFWI